MMGIAELMQQMRASGPMHNAPMTFVASIMNALAEATMDFMIQDPANAKNLSLNRTGKPRFRARGHRVETAFVSLGP